MKNLIIILLVTLSQFVNAQIPTVAYIESKSGKYGLQDENGNILVDTVFDRMMFDGVNQETGEALLKKGKNWLLINYKADIVTMFSGYNLNSSIQHGVIAAENIKTGKSGYLNKLGEVVVPFNLHITKGMYNKFGLGVAAISDKKYGVMNSLGEWVLKPKFNHIDEILGEDYFVVYTKGDYWVVNKEGKLLEIMEIGC